MNFNSYHNYAQVGFEGMSNVYVYNLMYRPTELFCILALAPFFLYLVPNLNQFPAVELYN